MGAAVETALAALRPRWAGFWPAADGGAMATDLRARLRAAVAAWDLEAVEILGGGHVALVAGARHAGAPVVVKLSPRGHEDDAQLAAEGVALAHWQATGAVPRLRARRDGGLTLLLERLEPGTTLDDASVPWPQRLAVLARLVARLHAAGAPPDGVVALRHYARGWRRDLAPEPALVAELDARCVPAATDVLLHADLHGANALRDGPTWRAIDPHAVRGDPDADCWALIDPAAPALPADARDTARAWVARYAHEAGLDAHGVAAWARLRARAEALRIDGGAAGPDDRAWAVRLHRMADALTP